MRRIFASGAQGRPGCRPTGRARQWLRVALLMLAAGLSALANGAEPVTAPAYLAQVLPDARLAGQGTFRYFGLRIYDARLWVGAQGYSPAAPETQPFALTLVYARGFKGKQIAQRSIDEIKHLRLGNVEQQQAWLEQMTRVLPDVQTGTELSGVYEPAHGARFYLDGKFIGAIADPQFAYAFFAIWLAPQTSAPALREALLADLPAARP
jgi:hypothetical protein